MHFVPCQQVHTVKGNTDQTLSTAEIEHAADGLTAVTALDAQNTVIPDIHHGTLCRTVVCDLISAQLLQAGQTAEYLLFRSVIFMNPGCLIPIHASPVDIS